MTNTFKRHAAELDAGFYGEGFIRGFKMAMNELERARNGHSALRKTFSALTSTEIDVLQNRIETEHPRVRDEQAKKGLGWLLKLWHTPRGTVRKNSPFSAREENVLRNFDHFEVVGWYDTQTHGNGYAWYIPVYRALARDGSHFDYYAGSWQSGIPLTIVG